MANRPAGEPPEGYLWLKQAANYLGYTASTLYKWRQEDYGPKGEVIGRRRIAYPIQELDRFLGRDAASSRRTPAAA